MRIVASREIRLFKSGRSMVRNHLETPFGQETLYCTFFYAERPAFSGSRYRFKDLLFTVKPVLTSEHRSIDVVKGHNAAFRCAVADETKRTVYRVWSQIHCHAFP